MAPNSSLLAHWIWNSFVLTRLCCCIIALCTQCSCAGGADRMWTDGAVIACIVLCWQYTAADTSWESTAVTYGPRLSRAKGPCQSGVGGLCRRGTASCRESSWLPCPAQTRSAGQCCHGILEPSWKLVRLFIRRASALSAVANDYRFCGMQHFLVSWR